MACEKRTIEVVIIDSLEVEVDDMIVLYFM